ncbi:uncharacterized protein LOC123430353 [Hordeum vulgare subsp. vulgare]|uniref:C2H2-type domain-containing protein n=1 Tax=Hordeum vulgare subsp. vulgare TaxID=112509 RepID=A0A8I7B6M5_HORVV|nr:uncharacterized protein LOC123430353 [Hordeum vulgare subsp. vulgare]
MDPNISYPNKLKSSESDAYISPLHEVLRGTIAMPVSNDTLSFESLPLDLPSAVNSSPAIDAPPEGAMISVNDSSMMPHQMNVGLAPLPPQLSDTISNPLSMVNTITSQYYNEEIHQDGYEMVWHEDILSNPLSNYVDSYHHMNTSSMESPSFTSSLRADPNSIVYTHLNTTRALEDGSISEMPTRNGFENMQNGRLRYDASYGAPAPISPLMMSSHVQTEDKTPPVGPNGIFDSAILHDSTTSGKYTCKICGRTFITSQAYGGHMSSHAKAKKHLHS